MNPSKINSKGSGPRSLPSRGRLREGRLPDGIRRQRVQIYDAVDVPLVAACVGRIPEAARRGHRGLQASRDAPENESRQKYEDAQAEEDRRGPVLEPGRPNFREGFSIRGSALVDGEARFRRLVQFLKHRRVFCWPVYAIACTLQLY